MQSLKPWLDYIENSVGFVLPSVQRHWLSNAIDDIASKSGLSPAQLYKALPDSQDLHQSLIDRVLIAESRFFRDKAALAWIADNYGKQERKTPFCALSVGCSTGQEAWSLAMALEAKKRRDDAFAGYCVCGVDASKAALAKAKTARYNKRQWQYVPSVYRKYAQWATPDFFEPNDALKKQVDFAFCNIFDAVSVERLKTRLPYAPDAILCQNLLIYFRQFDQRDILDRLAQLLKNGGHLILGAGEALFWRPRNMQKQRCLDVNVWQKTA